LACTCWDGYLTISFAQAQYLSTSRHEAEEIKKRILLVGFAEEEKDVLNELKEDADFLSKYKAEIAGKNQALELAIKSNWNYNSEVIYKPFSEAKRMMNKEKGKYAFLHFSDEIGNSFLISNFNNNSNYRPYGYSYEDTKLVYNYGIRYSIAAYNISTLEIDLPGTAISVYLPKSYPTASDLTFGVLNMQYILNYLILDKENTIRKLFSKQVVINAAELKTKTLLLDINEFTPETKMEDINKGYPFPLKILPFSDIEKIIETKDTNFVVVNFCRFDDNNRVNFVSNAGNGKIYKCFTSLAYDIPNEGETFRRIYYPGIKIINLNQYAY
jgi:hypothetical protein